MARGKATSSEDKAKVILAKIENPDKSLRDIEKETGVKKDAVGDIINNELPVVATSSDKVIELVNVNTSIMINGKRAIDNIVKDLEKEDSKVKIQSMTDVRSLSSVLEDAFKQNQLLTGWDTDRKTVKLTRDMTDEELLELAWI